MNVLDAALHLFCTDNLFAEHGQEVADVVDKVIAALLHLPCKGGGISKGG